MSNTFDKLSILDSFIEEVNSYLPQIETNLERLTQSPADMDALEETSRFTHTIGGAASMMDFPGLAHVAHGMEDILGDALDGLTVLDEATLGLLKRSLGRLHQLLAGVHSGINEEAVIAEDDEDYARYRAMIEPMLNAQQADTHEGGGNGGSDGYVPISDSYSTGQPASSAYDSSLPSFDEVLASFRTPVVLPDEEVAWPEDPLPARQFNTGMLQAPQESYLPQGGVGEFGPAQPSSPFAMEQPNQSTSNTSALEALVASTRQPTLPPSSFMKPAPEMPPPPVVEESPRNAQMAGYPMDFEANVEGQYTAMVLAQDNGSTLPTVYENMRRDADSLQGQVTSLKGLLTSLRSAMSLIDVQRSEFKGFLNGSKDALDRMEEWAGQAMGLNLRNSPEQVRRYLPLSVMWVANSKLKKVMDLLSPVMHGVELTDEQMEMILQQLQASIIATGEGAQQGQLSMPPLKQDPGWSPWEM